MTMTNPEAVMADAIEPATACDHGENGYSSDNVRYLAPLIREVLPDLFARP